jgi:hypothetical protein
MMGEGRVVIDLSRRPGGPVAVAFHAPGDVARLLEGKAPAAVIDVVPSLFTVCAMAQAQAAVMALEAARGLAVSSLTAAARQALTAAETLREHALRIALDWPRLAGGEAQGRVMRPLLALPSRLAEALFGEGAACAIGREARPDRGRAMNVIDEAEALLVAEIFGEPLEVWLARRGRGSLIAWARTAPPAAGALIEKAAEAGLLEPAGGAPPRPVAVEAVFAAWLADPQRRSLLPWRTANGPVPEATFYSRRAGDPLLQSLGGAGLGVRLIARLVELARLPGEMRALLAGRRGRCGRAAAAGGAAIAAVEAARGLLIHAVEVERGLIARYQVLPPTRWNFDAEGIAARCLACLEAEGEAERVGLAHLVVNAVDPCVAYDVRIN